MGRRGNTYTGAMKRNREFAREQLARQISGKSSAPTQAQIDEAYESGSDNLTDEQLRKMRKRLAKKADDKNGFKVE